MGSGREGTSPRYLRPSGALSPVVAAATPRHASPVAVAPPSHRWHASPVAVVWPSLWGWRPVLLRAAHVRQEPATPPPLDAASTSGASPVDADVQGDGGGAGKPSRDECGDRAPPPTAAQQGQTGRW